MKKKIILIGVLLGCCFWTTAQNKIELRQHEPYSMKVRLYDDSKTQNDFLLSLPLTFNLAEKNILIMMVGDDTPLSNGRSVWFFSDEMDFTELVKKDKNVGATKAFKNQNKVLNEVLYHKKMMLHRPFDDDYEIVKKNVKPVFFEILDPAPDKPLTFSLQFYVSKPDANFPYFFIAKCDPINIELIIKN